MTAPLTPERLFSDPRYIANPPRDIRLSPDGRFASYLKADDNNRERLDLWGLELAQGESKRWLAATELPSAASNAAQRGRQERKRLFGHGITGHAWSNHNATLLVQAAGAGYLLDVANRSIGQATPAGHGHSDVHLSPQGRFVSYVRDRSLLYWHLDSGIDAPSPARKRKRSVSVRRTFSPRKRCTVSRALVAP